jgi:hypothetical protein
MMYTCPKVNSVKRPVKRIKDHNVRFLKFTVLFCRSSSVVVTFPVSSTTGGGCHPAKPIFVELVAIRNICFAAPLTTHLSRPRPGRPVHGAVSGAPRAGIRRLCHVAVAGLKGSHPQTPPHRPRPANTSHDKRINGDFSPHSRTVTGTPSPVCRYRPCCGLLPPRYNP